MSEILLFQTDGRGVARLTLNRPERLNALGGTLREDLHDAVTRASADPEVRVMVITGAGKGFCAGGDVKAMAEGTEMSGTTLEERAHGLRTYMEVSRWLHEMPKPTLAVIPGPAAGAGSARDPAASPCGSMSTVMIGVPTSTVTPSGTCNSLT